MDFSRVSKNEVRKFFQAPISETRNHVDCKWNSREACLVALVSIVPSKAVNKIGGYGYDALASTARAICQIFRAIAFRKGACKALMERVWNVLDSLAAIAITLLSTVIKAIRCILGAVIHPAIAAKAN